MDRTEFTREAGRASHKWLDILKAAEAEREASIKRLTAAVQREEAAGRVGLAEIYRNQLASVAERLGTTRAMIAEFVGTPPCE